MTKKDFELIAATLRRHWAAQPGLVRDIAQDFANELAATNPRFKRDLFLRACGVDS